jgi:hypothetical protein
MENLYKTLRELDVSKHVEKKGEYNYLAWAFAWDTLKCHYPEARYEKHVFNDLPYMQDEQGYTYVMVTVKAGQQSVTELLPVLNFNNKPVTKPNSFDVNTALQRCLVKAIAECSGIGLYLYLGESAPPSGDVVSAPAADEKMRYLEELCRELDKPFSEAQKWLRDNDNNLSFLVSNLEANLKKKEAV